jgi:7-cyano-7-deazaguanine synthase
MSGPSRDARAVLLLSGGLDSYTAGALLKARGFCLYALSIRYGQRHVRELESATKIARALGVAQHLVVPLDLGQIGGSALTTDEPVPRDRDVTTPSPEIPSTYVPARNTIFLALALGWAEVLGASDLIIGANAVDYSGYPDCRPAFLRAFESLAAVATKAGVEGLRFRVHAPLLEMTKAEIIRQGLALGLDFGLTHSCYDPAPGGEPCRRCDSCLLRAKGFAEAGSVDPLIG